MKNHKLLLLVIFVLGLLSFDLSAQPPAITPKKDKITGVVKDELGKPVKDAHVKIYTARVRKGTSDLCPTCYADCRKSAVTDDQGAFEIAGVSDDLIFQLLVASPGHKTAVVGEVDPEKPSVSVTLKPHEIGGYDLKGSVVDHDGHPVIGAHVAPYSFINGDSTLFGSPKRDLVAITDQKGEFLLSVEKGYTAVGLEVSASGFAPKRLSEVGLDDQAHRLAIDPGVRVTGRLLREGKGVEGADVGIVVTDRACDNFYDDVVVKTDREGGFSFPNVPSGREYFVYGLRGRKNDSGVTPSKKIETGSPGSSFNAGDITLESGQKVEGRIILNDGKRLPPNTRILVDREDAWDPQIIETDQEGRFSFVAREGEKVRIFARLKGYVMTSEKDLNNNFCLTVTPSVKEATLTFAPEGSPDLQLRAQILTPSGAQGTNSFAKISSRFGGPGLINLDEIGVPGKSKFQADASGYISFSKPEGKDSWIFIADPEGYAVLQTKDFHDTITLVPWARLNGVATWANKAATNKVVTVEIVLPQGGPGSTESAQSSFSIQRILKVSTDSSFEEVKIPAGQIWKFCDKVDPEKQQFENLQMGQKILTDNGCTTYASLGASGTLIKGSIKLPSDPSVDLDNTLTHMSCRENSNFIYAFKIKPDGSFQIENVMPGSYTINIILMRKNRSRPMDSIGSVTGSFEVKEGMTSLELPTFQLRQLGKQTL